MRSPLGNLATVLVEDPYRVIGRTRRHPLAVIVVCHIMNVLSTWGARQLCTGRVLSLSLQSPAHPRSASRTRSDSATVRESTGTVPVTPINVSPINSSLPNLYDMYCNPP